MPKRRQPRGNPRPYWVKTRKRYVAKYWGADGQPHTVSDQTKEGAKRKQDEARRLAEAQVRVTDANTTLGTFLQEWVASKAPPVRRPNTYQAYVWALGHVVNHLGTVKLCKLRAGDIERMERKLSLSPASLQLVHTTLGQALKLAVKRRYLIESPMTTVDRPKVERLPRRTLQLDQARALLEKAPRDRWYAFWMLALATGFRSGELRGLTWDDIDETTGLIHVRRQAVRMRADEGKESHEMGPLKSKAAGRPMPVEPSILEILAAHKQMQRKTRMMSAKWEEHNLVFPGRHGTIMSGASPLTALTRTLERLNLPNRTVHELRHTFATLEMDLVTNPADVQHLLGHASLGQTTGTYVHTGPASKQRATAELTRELLDKKA